MNHPHKVLHFAMESPTKVDLGHTWTEGLLTHYRLTGETRSLAAARGIADRLLLAVSKAGNPRQLGWPMLALTAVYDATGDPRYRDGAVAFADAALDRVQPTPASGDWKMGILADGMAAVHAMTNDQRLRRWLVSYADALLPEIGRYADARYALPLGYVTTITGEPRYGAVGQQVVRTMKIGEWGKPLAIAGRTGFRILSPLATKAPVACARRFRRRRRGEDGAARGSRAGRGSGRPSAGVGASSPLRHSGRRSRIPRLSAACVPCARRYENAPTLATHARRRRRTGADPRPSRTDSFDRHGSEVRSHVVAIALALPLGRAIASAGVGPASARHHVGRRTRRSTETTRPPAGPSAGAPRPAPPPRTDPATNRPRHRRHEARSP